MICLAPQIRQALGLITYTNLILLLHETFSIDVQAELSEEKGCHCA